MLIEPTGRTSAGYPYLSRPAWARLRDWIPHLFRSGLAVEMAVDIGRPADHESQG